ncbi:division/cell wall cluster transcriptional repressor MraZ [Anaerolentibacter hominis]|uniref:division/cell wall cluster transcriptional repressor MraZ n=1 Tax=Anaerolentibacter hominis TaxID=3079009 RepID=UPI0031B808CA
MFMGEFNHTIDSKGRVIMPAKFRDALGEEFVITVGLDGCLFVYPQEDWEKFMKEMLALPGNKEVRQMQRYFFSNAISCEIDKQGRVLIPSKLRDAGKLEKDVVFVGVMNKIEIWSKERWLANNTYDNMDEIAERMSEYGLGF